MNISKILNPCAISNSVTLIESQVNAPRVNKNLSLNPRHLYSFSIQTEVEAEDFIRKRKGMALAIMQNTTSMSKVHFCLFTTNMFLSFH